MFQIAIRSASSLISHAKRQGFCPTAGKIGMLAVASSGCRSYVPVTDFLPKIPSPEQVQQKRNAVASGTRA